jgi:hypothetical protein
MKKLLTAMVLVASTTAVTAQEIPMPTAGPEHKALSIFAGKWSFEGKAEEGPMGPGGPVTFTENCEMSDGGFALVCRAEGKNPMGPVKTLAIMTYDAEKKAYTYYAVEPGMQPFMAIGKNEGKAWNWMTEMNMGGQTMKTAVTVTVPTPTSQTFEMKMSTDGGKTWVPLMSGKSTKSGT